MTKINRRAASFTITPMTNFCNRTMTDYVLSIIKQCIIKYIKHVNSNKKGKVNMKCNDILTSKPPEIRQVLVLRHQCKPDPKA